MFSLAIDCAVVRVAAGVDAALVGSGVGGDILSIGGPAAILQPTSPRSTRARGILNDPMLDLDLFTDQ